MARPEQGTRRGREKAASTLGAHVPRIELTLLVGRYAQAHFPRVIPLPHPSPRTIAWFKANPWFDDELVPVLRHTVHKPVGS